MKMTNVSEYFRENQKEIYIKYTFMPLSMAFRIKLVLAFGGISRQRHNDQNVSREAWGLSMLSAVRAEELPLRWRHFRLRSCPREWGTLSLTEMPTRTGFRHKDPRGAAKLGVWTREMGCGRQTNPSLWATPPSST